jgi:ribosomal protein L7/L12
MSTETELIDLRQRIVRLEGQVEYLYKRLGINIDVEPASVDESEVIVALQKGNLIEAIKVYRQLYNVGLAEAKTAVENLKYRLNI